MTQPTPDQFLSCVPDSISAAHRFSHEAMATVFEIFIVHDDAHYAGQAAWAAFDELDKIEQNLSRYIDNSDISQINRLAAGQSLKLSLDAFRCLQLSAEIYDQTNGAFDITIGSLLDLRLEEDKTMYKPSSQDLDSARRRTGMSLLKLDEASHTVTLSTSPVRIDLGGIGKGYAVDRMAELLADWSINTALLHAGQSSVLALGAPPRAIRRVAPHRAASQREGWPVKLANPDNPSKTLAHLYLCDRALSGSGLQKGFHIIDPRCGLAVEGKRAAWSSAPDATTADALSTAFMVMAPDEIKKYCRRHPDAQAMIILQDESLETRQGRILHFGSWRFDKQSE
jgi:thiamine biosynthesis lipoprotein